MSSAGKWVRTLLVLAVVAAVLAGGVIFRGDLTDALELLLSWIQRFPVWAPVLFVIVASVSTVLSLPTGLPMNLAAGVIWGGAAGGALTILAATISGSVCFLVSRRFSPRLLEKLIERPVSRALLRAVEEHGTLFVALARVNPIMPYALASYLFGVSKIGFRKYILVSAIASAPGTFLFSYLGEAVRDIVLPQEQLELVRIVGLIALFITIGLVAKFTLPKVISARKRGPDGS